MAKIKKGWFCKECGNESSKWMGKCPACGEWNTMVEEIISKGVEKNITSRSKAVMQSFNSKPMPLTSIEMECESRIVLGSDSTMNLGELDKVLGGGLVRALGRAAVRDAVRGVVLGFAPPQQAVRHSPVCC